MKPVIVFVAAFVVAAAGGAGASVMLGKRATPPDSASAKAHTDSMKSTDTAVVDSNKANPAPVDSAAKPAVPATDSSHAAAPTVPALNGTVKPPAATTTTPAAAAANAANAANAATTAATAAAAESLAVQTRRVAKVFSSMAPREAAKVLEHMTDTDVEVILGYVGAKQSAAILAALPPDRAAVLSKSAMRGAPKGTTP